MPTAHMSTDGCEALSAMLFRFFRNQNQRLFKKLIPGMAKIASEMCVAERTYNAALMPMAHMSTDGCEALSAAEIPDFANFCKFQC